MCRKSLRSNRKKRKSSGKSSSKLPETTLLGLSGKPMPNRELCIVLTALALASTPKRTHAEVEEQNSEKDGNNRTPRSNLACRVGMILAPAGDAADQSEPKEQESSDLQPKNLADPPKRLQKTTDSCRNSLENPPALLPFLKGPGHFAQHGADRARRRRFCPQRIRKTAHKGILDHFRESCIPKAVAKRSKAAIAGAFQFGIVSSGPPNLLLKKL
jgi:hypothetical protein